MAMSWTALLCAATFGGAAALDDVALSGRRALLTTGARGFSASGQGESDTPPLDKPAPGSHWAQKESKTEPEADSAPSPPREGSCKRLIRSIDFGHKYVMLH
jgi:hypothetical protein